MKSDLSAYN